MRSARGAFTESLANINRKWAVILILDTLSEVIPVSMPAKNAL
jgi:hypothetical protein